MLSADDAVATCKLLEQRSIRFWAMGGWGVDALLHRETRPHKDLDVLVLLGDLPKLWNLLDAQGFTCVSKETQLAMHTGYTLPDGQLRDLALLQADC